MFGKINLYIQSHFRSSYGLALYENCSRYQGLAFTKWFEINVFRKMMGVDDDKYTIFRDFKRRVLDKAVDEVNSFSNLFIEPEYQKKARQIIRIRFSLKERSKKKRLGKITQSADDVAAIEGNMSDLVLKLINIFQISHESAKDIVSNYQESYILEKIHLVETSKKFQDDKVKNPAGFLVEALKRNYKITSLEPIKNNKFKKVKASISIKKAVDEKTKYYRFQVNQIVTLFKEKGLNKDKELIKEFEQYLGKSLYRNIYVREGMNNLLVQDQFYEFIKCKKPELLKLIPAF
jgi:plasmid replication initiation protein